VAVGGMNDTRQHLGDVVRAVLGRWRIFERYDFGGHGAKPPRKSPWCCRLEGEATQPGESKAHYLERENYRAATKPPNPTAKQALPGDV
jgi:hypothetical protein